MTNADIIALIFSEASGKSLEVTKLIVSEMARVGGFRSKFNDEVPEGEAQRLLAGLRRESSAIREWFLVADRMEHFATEAATKH